MLSSFRDKLNFENRTINKGATGIFVKEHCCHEVPKREIKMGEIEGNWQPVKFYCSEIKLIYSMSSCLGLYVPGFSLKAFLTVAHISFIELTREKKNVRSL